MDPWYLALAVVSAIVLVRFLMSVRGGRWDWRSIHSFTCPRCGGHEFGSADPLGGPHVVSCQTDGCPGFSGPYGKHVRPMRGPITGVDYVSTALGYSPAMGYPAASAALTQIARKHEVEFLDRERDARWVRVNRLRDWGKTVTDPAFAEAQTSFERSLKAKDMTELFGLDSGTCACGHVNAGHYQHAEGFRCAVDGCDCLRTAQREDRS